MPNRHALARQWRRSAARGHATTDPIKIYEAMTCQNGWLP